MLRVTVGRLTKLFAIVSELQHTQAFKCTAKEKDLRINRKWWFFQAPKAAGQDIGYKQAQKGYWSLTWSHKGTDQPKKTISLTISPGS